MHKNKWASQMYKFSMEGMNPAVIVPIIATAAAAKDSSCSKTQQLQQNTETTIAAV